jgi:large subunit ribosomal protein L32
LSKTKNDGILQVVKQFSHIILCQYKSKGTPRGEETGRAQLKLKVKGLVKCTHCGASIPAHTVCPKCGYYKGKEVVNTLKKIKKK